MDFGGMLGADALIGAPPSEGGSGSSSSSSLVSSSLTSHDAQVSRQRGGFGSSFQKHDRPAEAEDYDWRSLKMAWTEASVTASAKGAPFLPRSNSHSLFPDGEQMLSFSSGPKLMSSMAIAADGALPSTECCYLRNAGLYSGSSNANMQGVLARVRGPFTPSQWLELEHQALIYKYLVANVPIPATLLVPIRRSLSAAGYPPFSAASFGSVGWGAFHLYSGTADPEPGRCRRTDGKKWRCSRDAVADQKYCERHMNRGRHRSRKHVEGRAGHAAKAMPRSIAASQSQPAPAVPDGSSSGNLALSQQQSKNMQSNTTNPCLAQFTGLTADKEDQNACSKGLSMLNPVIQKPMNQFEGTSSAIGTGRGFGFIPTGSLGAIRIPNNASFIPNWRLTDDGHDQSHLLRQFMDVCPKNKPGNSSVTWPEIEESHSDRTQLSISIPMACSNFSTSSSSNHGKISLSPLLRLAREDDPAPVGLGVGLLNEVCHQYASRRPISWEASMAGPLGEVLICTNNTSKDQNKNCSSLSSRNILTDGWDSNSQSESSPSRVLSKTSFVSLSSSTGSSPRAENPKIHENSSSLCNNLLGSVIVNAPTIPSL